MNFSEIISVFAALLSPFSVYIYHLFHRAFPLHFPHFPHQTTCKLLLRFIAPLSSLLTVVYFYFPGYGYPSVCIPVWRFGDQSLRWKEPAILIFLDQAYTIQNIIKSLPDFSVIALFPSIYVNLGYWFYIYCLYCVEVC